jgi:hypothetical protein
MWTSRRHEGEPDFLVRYIRLHALNQRRKFIPIDLSRMILLREAKQAKHTSFACRKGVEVTFLGRFWDI